MRGNRTPITSVACSYPTIERSPLGQCGQRGSNPRRRGGSPTPYLWTIPATNGADSGSRTRIGRVGSCHLDRWTMSALRGSPRGAAREDCTRRLLRTKQAPRCLGLSSARGGTGRDRTDYLLTAGQALSQVSYGPMVEAGRPPPGRGLRDGAADPPRRQVLGHARVPARNRRTNKDGDRGAVYKAGNPRFPARPGGATGTRTPIPTMRR